jgi:multiple RNA-binding domain-containing protein 1
MPVDEKRLYVTNIPFSSTEAEVRQVFEKFGTIVEMKLPKGKGG